MVDTVKSVARGASARGLRRVRFVLAMLTVTIVMLTPAAVLAQSAFAGVVKDTSGAVLPGVTVEATSPVLIEKSRSVVTDDKGQYKLLDLRPGVYTVTFTLAGFNTVRRDGIDLPASFTATVNADLPVGSVEEALTVTGEAPVVDVQRTAQTQVMSKAVLDSVPTALVRLPQSYTLLLPGVVQSGGGQQGLGTSTNSLQIHGSRTGEYNTDIDGVSSRRLSAGGAGTYYYVNQGTVQEVVVAMGNNDADQQAAGVVTNVIPKEGSNTYNGSFYIHYTGESLEGNNVNDALKAAGVTVGGVKQEWDVNPSVGGPLKKDKLWFFASYRYFGTTINIPGNYYNSTPLGWVYTPDLNRPAAATQSSRSHSVRFTYQATPRNKVSAFFDLQPYLHHNRDFARTVSPEAQTWSPIVPNYLGQATWKSPVSNRILFQAGIAYFVGYLLQYPQTHDPDLLSGPAGDPVNAVSALELSTGTRFRSANMYGDFAGDHAFKTKVSASYITGTHAFKVGMDFNGGREQRIQQHNGDYQVSLRTPVGNTVGVPTSITLFTPFVADDTTNADLGIYGQDQWTLKQVTLNLGLRFDYFNASVPAQDEPANRWVPAHHFDPVDGVPIWRDISPRVGASFDVFGNGKTAIKAGLSRYVAGAGRVLAGTNPVEASVISATRTWTDSNGNFIPNCDFTNPAANQECGTLSDLNFGQANPRATRNDPNIVTGYGKRGYNWESSVSVQHEIRQGISVNAGYFRRWYGNFTVTDNLLVTSGDFNPYCLTLPVDSRLPGGGGNTLCGFYDVKAAKQGQTTNLVTFASNYGKETEVYNGIDVSVSARLPHGAQISGGTSTGRSDINTCFVIDSPGGIPAAGNSSSRIDWCDNKPPFQTNFKFLVVYPLPWWGLQVNATFFSLPGSEISTTSYVATNNEVRGTLGRNLAAGANGTVTLPIMAPGSLYTARSNKADLRFSKAFRFGQRRLTGSVDVFNILNSSDTLSVNTRYGPDWLKPTQILNARQVRLSASLDF